MAKGKIIYKMMLRYMEIQPGGKDLDTKDSIKFEINGKSDYK